MGYKDYAKDYEIEYVLQPGRKKPSAKRIYVGPYYRFTVPAERLRRLKGLLSVLLLTSALMLVLPLCTDCVSTRTWYVQLPASAAWIPWLLAAASLFRLFTAGEKVEREHYDMIYARMGGASVFLMILCAVSVVGSVLLLSKGGAAREDFMVLACHAMVLLSAFVIFRLRRELSMEETENPEKPQAKKRGTK